MMMGELTILLNLLVMFSRASCLSESQFLVMSLLPFPILPNGGISFTNEEIGLLFAHFSQVRSSH
jgi:hypothetical protein